MRTTTGAQLVTKPRVFPLHFTLLTTSNDTFHNHFAKHGDLSRADEMHRIIYKIVLKRDITKHFVQQVRWVP